MDNYKCKCKCKPIYYKKSLSEDIPNELENSSVKYTVVCLKVDVSARLVAIFTKINFRSKNTGLIALFLTRFYAF